jgi:hypothetical protein
MKKRIVEVDEKRGIWQVTTTDERWYGKQIEDPTTGLPKYAWVPSVTWIAGHYPKGLGFYKWLADKGWDESQAIKQAAGNKGSKVHQAISAILQGQLVRIDSKFINHESGQLEELTLDEVDCIRPFIDWYRENKPETIDYDVTVFSDKYGYAGTIDYICRIGEQVWIIDFKTSQDVWSESSTSSKPCDAASMTSPSNSSAVIRVVTGSQPDFSSRCCWFQNATEEFRN